MAILKYLIFSSFLFTNVLVGSPFLVLLDFLAPLKLEKMYCKIQISLWNVLGFLSVFLWLHLHFCLCPGISSCLFISLGLNTALWKFSLSQNFFSPWSNSYPNTQLKQRLEVSAPKNKCCPFPSPPQFCKYFHTFNLKTLHNSIHKNYCCKALFWSHWCITGVPLLCAKTNHRYTLQSACFELRSIALFSVQVRWFASSTLRKYVERNYSSQFTQRWGGEMKFSVCLDETVFMFLDLISLILVSVQ